MYKKNVGYTKNKKLSNLDLNINTLGEVTTSLGKEFQAFIIRWEKVKPPIHG